MTNRRNALWNCKNPYQGKFEKVLTVCSAGLLRSPTIAWYLNKHTDYNCRAAGIHDYALVQVDDVLITWAQVIICAEYDIYDHIITKYDELLNQGNQRVINLDIPDNFAYRDEKLVEIIAEKLEENGFLV